MMRKSLYLFLALLTAMPTSHLHASETLFVYIDERLELMREVAAYKWLNQLPVEAPEREAVVIERAVFDGLQYGLTRTASTAFFSAQIEAAKDIQHCWHARWQQSGAPESAQDLNAIVRPALINLGSKIVENLARPEEQIDQAARDQFNKAVAVDCLSPESKNQLFDALGRIEQYPNLLSQIEHSGILRVGTTGDYAPFSFAADPSAADDSDYQYRGIDIDLARRLAIALKANVRFVKTSWPTLMQDLHAGKYDIAMSGVSIIESRAAVAFFTEPYHLGGKTPIARCSDVDELGSLASIDQPGNKIIVNPGGTNERFLDENIQLATKILHDDNRTIFDEIDQGRADVMITDAIEVALKSHQYASLCATMPGKTLTVQTKGYMMPRDSIFKAAVDNWLLKERVSGRLQATFQTHLNQDAK